MTRINREMVQIFFAKSPPSCVFLLLSQRSCFCYTYSCMKTIKFLCSSI
ncbi:hypothetical protein LINPERHAP2_LOCUS10575 [Linum perenne]